jgi:peptide/nickel transport system permease protein
VGPCAAQCHDSGDHGDGLQFADLLAGTIVVENVFYLPGLGRLIFQSISNRDLIVVRNCVMLLAAMVVIVNFIVDCCTR